MKKGGALKGCLIAVGVFFVILIVGAVLVFVNRGKIIQAVQSRVIEVFEKQVAKKLPEDYDQKNFSKMMGTLRKGFRENRITGKEIGILSTNVKEVLKDGEITSEEMEGIEKLVERIYEEEVEE